MKIQYNYARRLLFLFSTHNRILQWVTTLLRSSAHSNSLSQPCPAYHSICRQKWSHFKLWIEIQLYKKSIPLHIRYSTVIGSIRRHTFVRVLCRCISPFENMDKRLYFVFPVFVFTSNSKQCL
jgi:hypothetical protein